MSLVCPSEPLTDYHPTTTFAFDYHYKTRENTTGSQRLAKDLDERRML